MGCVLGRDDRGSDSIVVDSMSDDEAEKAAGSGRNDKKIHSGMSRFTT